jgi:hypothetical protein
MKFEFTCIIVNLHAKWNKRAKRKDAKSGSLELRRVEKVVLKIVWYYYFSNNLSLINK